VPSEAKAKSQKAKTQKPKPKANSQTSGHSNGRFALQNAPSLQIREFCSKMQQIAREAAPD
jgi:hypothetical protein